MSLPVDQIVISADDHLDIHAMPPDLWSSRLPEQWRERGPRVEPTPEGPYWFCGGRRVAPSGRKGAGYLAADEHGFRPGQPRTRLEDMDRDGVRAQVVYGPTCTQLQITDAALHEQVARVYNDWAAEFQREAPDRLLLLPDLPSYDPQVARRLLVFLRPYRRHVAGALALLLLLGASEAARPLLIRRAIDDHIAVGDVAGLWIPALSFFGLLVFELLAGAVRSYLTTWVGQRSMHDLRERLFDRLQRLPVAFFDRTAIGRLITRVTRAYDEYQFHTVFHAVHNFCAVDLSAQYLDIIKDRLYTSAANDPRRRAAQTVCFDVFSALARDRRIGRAGPR